MLLLRIDIAGEPKASIGAYGEGVSGGTASTSSLLELAIISNARSSGQLVDPCEREERPVWKKLWPSPESLRNMPSIVAVVIRLGRGC